MALPTIADTIRTAVRGVAPNGHAWANIMHFRKTGALSYAGAIAILDPKLLAQYSTNSGAGLAWKGAAPTTSALTQFEYTPLDGSTATTVVTHAVPGISGGDALPPSVALVVTLRTGTRGRSYRGRVYTGPYDESYSTAGKPTSALVTSIATQWERFVTVDLVGSGVSLVVASYLHGTAEDVLHATVDGRWDTQRRRLNA